MHALFFELFEQMGQNSCGRGLVVVVVVGIVGLVVVVVVVVVVEVVVVGVVVDVVVGVVVDENSWECETNIKESKFSPLKSDLKLLSCRDETNGPEFDLKLLADSKFDETSSLLKSDIKVLCGVDFSDGNSLKEPKLENPESELKLLIGSDESNDEFSELDDEGSEDVELGWLEELDLIELGKDGDWPEFKDDDSELNWLDESGRDELDVELFELKGVVDTNELDCDDSADEELFKLDNVELDSENTDEFEIKLLDCKLDEIDGVFVDEKLSEFKEEDSVVIESGWLEEIDSIELCKDDDWLELEEDGLELNWLDGFDSIELVREESEDLDSLKLELTVEMTWLDELRSVELELGDR